MITLAPAIYSLLSADAALVALVGARITPDRMDQVTTTTAKTPALVFTSWFVSSVETFDGPSGLEKHRVQLDAYATTRAAADAVLAAADAVLCRRLLAGSHWRTVGTVEVQAAVKVGSGSPPTFETDTNLYRRSQDFLVTCANA